VLETLNKNRNEKTTLTIQDVRETYEKMYKQKRIHPMQKIKLKAWLYHSESRHRNGNAPFLFQNYTHAVGKQIYMEYINFGLIDCEDLGGKEEAFQIIKSYYGF